MGEVYHVSDKRGLKIFVPRRFWHTPDFRRSDSLAEGIEPPEGTSLIYAFYASSVEREPFYFSPPPVRRIHLQKGKHADFEIGLRQLEIPEIDASRVFVLEKRSEEKLHAQQFSIYAFDDSDFRRVPTGEFIAEVPVAPTRETFYADAFAEIQRCGVHLTFVDDLGDTFRRLNLAALSFDTQGHFEGR